MPISKVDPNSFKIHCHAIYKIMADTRGKSPKQQYEEAENSLYEKTERMNNMIKKDGAGYAKLHDGIIELKKQLPELEKHRDDVALSDTCITHLEGWAKEQLTGKRSEVISKYLTKGIINEQEGIDMASDYLGGYFQKNETLFQDDEIIGTPDVIERPKFVLDNKCVYSLDTFPMFKKEVPKKAKEAGYPLQGQGYLALTSLPLFKLSYTLTDTPIHLIESAASRYCWHYGYIGSEFEEERNAELEKFIENETYGDMDLTDKIRIFDIPRDDEAIAKIRERVHQCREYLKTILN